MRRRNRWPEISDGWIRNGRSTRECAPPTTPLPWTEPDLIRFESYNNCLRSISSWVNTYLSLPFELQGSLPFGANALLLHILSSLHKISTADDPVWDRRAAHCVIDLVPTCEKIVAVCEKLRAAPAMVSPDYGEDDASAKGVAILTNLRAAWQAVMSKIDAVDGQDSKAGQGVDMTDPGAVAVSQANASLDPRSTGFFESSWG